MSSQRFASLALVIFVTTLFDSAPAWAAERESRAMNAPVTAIMISGPINLDVRQGELKDAEIEADAKLRSRVMIENQSGEVHISLKRDTSEGWLDWTNSINGQVRVRLVVPSLNRVSVKGSGDITLGNFDLKQNELKLEVAGSGDIRAEQLQAKALSARILGSGDIHVGGSVDTLEVSIAGSGDYGGKKLRAVTNTVAIKGSGDATVWATGTLAVSILGSGDVRYAGQPAITQSIRGSGEVSPIK